MVSLFVLILFAGLVAAPGLEILAADTNVGQSKLNLDSIQLDSSALQVTGKGFIGLDQAVTFDLAVHLLGGGTPGGHPGCIRRLGRRGNSGFRYWYCRVPTSTAQCR